MKHKKRKYTRRKASSQNLRSKVLSVAEAAVNGSRQAVYASPEQNFQRIADLWSVEMQNTGRPVIFTSKDVAMFLIYVKTGRLAQSPGHFDSWSDIAGYAACGAEVSEAK